MIIEIKAPQTYLPTGIFPSVFLAGSIEMGEADLWQGRVVEAMRAWLVQDTLQAVLYNPRRDDWDSSWDQTVHDHNFNEQVNWELDQLAKANIVFFNFDPKTMSPITLLELGLCIGWNKKLVVVCPPDYMRCGNVRITCMRAGVPVYSSLIVGISKLKHFFETEAPPSYHYTD